MAVVGDQLAEEIIAAFPPTWNYRDKSRFNRQWLDALCSGFQSMWQAGTMTPGPGPPPGPNPHTHTLLPLVPATMAAPPKAVLAGKNGVTTLFADTISAQVALFVTANTTLDVQDGTVPHQHLFLAFGDPNTLSNQITSALQATGLFNVGASVLPVWFNAFSSALLAHLTANAATDALGAGADHVHALL
jgi:hypothetical protein